jgi:hypothetical protein
MSFKKTIFVVCSIIIVILSVLFLGKKEEKKYVDIEFIDGFNNSIVKLQRVQYGKALTLPENPKHDDYVFVGWFKDEEKKEEIKEFENIKENLRLIAHYEIDRNNNGIVDTQDKQYKVTFVDNITQDVLDTQMVLALTNAKVPSIPKHDGYVFLGWNKGYTDVKNDIVVTTNFKEEIKEINTFFLPLKIKKITRSETEEITVSIDKEQAINEAEKEIINRLKLQLPEKAEVYETKTSVQENDGIIKVSVYIETVENVAIRG